MLIDWFTVAAQAVNFLILMWLLKRFLYKPVLKAIDDREARIAATVKQAEDGKAAAEREHAALRNKNEAFALERVRLLAEAREEAKTAGKQLLEKERRAADASREKWRAALADEQRRFGDEVVRRVREEVFSILRQAFADLADTTLEARMLDVFEKRVRAEAAKGTLDGMTGAGTAGGRPLLVKTAFPLSDGQKDALRKTFSARADGREGADAREIDLAFQTEPELIGGVELIAGGRKIVWTLGDYLAKLEENTAALLTSPVASNPAAPVAGASRRPAPAPEGAR